MGDGGAFYGAFWVLPNPPLPVAGDLHADGDEPLPEPVLNRRQELQRVLASIDLTDAEQIQEAIGCCDQYVRSLRAARTVAEPEGRSMWTSAIISETAEIPFAFDEPMGLVLQANLLLNLGTQLAQKQTLECISEAAHCFCQAAGLAEYILTLQEDVCSSLQRDVPVELPELAPRILHALADIAVAMAQQLAIIKATLFAVETSPCPASVIQKLHSGCQFAYETFETAVVRSCYSARPKRHGCTTLLGFATVFSRLHRAQAWQLTGEQAFAATNVGKAIAFASAALRQLQERTSMRDVGLPPLEGRGGLHHQHDRLTSCIVSKRLILQQLITAWTKDNDTIYYEIVPSEETVLETELARAVIMNAAPHNATTRLGSVRMGTEMFSEIVIESSAADVVTTLNDTETEDGDDDDSEERQRESEGDKDGGDDNEASNIRAPEQEGGQVFSRLERDNGSGGVHDGQTIGGGDTSSTSLPLKSLQKHGTRPPSTLQSATTQSSLPLQSARSTRRMATRVQPQKSMTTRMLLGNIGKADSLITLQQTEEQLRKIVTDDALLHMRRTLLSGVEVYRLVKDKWKKEVLRVQDEHVVLIRKKAIALLSKQLKFAWASVHAFQHEMQPTNQVLQLLAPPGKRMTSILLIAQRGEMVEPTELTLKSPEENAVAVASLQQFLQEKGGATSAT